VSGGGVANCDPQTTWSACCRWCTFVVCLFCLPGKAKGGPGGGGGGPFLLAKEPHP